MSDTSDNIDPVAEGQPPPAEAASAEQPVSLEEIEAYLRAAPGGLEAVRRLLLGPTGPMHSTVWAASDDVDWQPDPHALAEAPVPTEGTLRATDQGTVAAGDDLAVVAETALWMGEVALTATYVQDSQPVGVLGWHWSGHDSPHAVRLPTGRGDGLGSYDPAQPATVALLLSVYDTQAPLATLSVEVAAAATRP